VRSLANDACLTRPAPDFSRRPLRLEGVAQRVPSGTVITRHPRDNGIAPKPLKGDGGVHWLHQRTLIRRAYSPFVPDAPLEELPRFIAPMLASTGPAPTEQGWALEVKGDGMRAQLRYDGRGICVRSRPGRSCTSEFPELADLR